MCNKIKTIYEDNSMTFKKQIDRFGGACYQVCANNNLILDTFFSTEAGISNNIDTYKLMNSHILNECIRKGRIATEDTEEALRDIMGFCLLSYCFKMERLIRFDPPEIHKELKTQSAIVDVPKINNGYLKVIVLKAKELDSSFCSLSASIQYDFTYDEVKEFIELARELKL